MLVLDDKIINGAQLLFGHLVNDSVVVGDRAVALLRSSWKARILRGCIIVFLRRGLLTLVTNYLWDEIVLSELNIDNSVFHDAHLLQTLI